MKIRLHRVWAGLWLAVVPVGLAEEVDPFDPDQRIDPLIRVQVEFVEVSHPTLTRLLAEPGNSVDDTALRSQLGALVARGEATVLETMMCLARPGEKASTESIEEFIYPTEYEPAELPNQIRITPKDENALEMVREMATGPTPTAFETRNLGTMLEVEPSLTDVDGVVDVKLSPEIVYHVKNDVWAEWKSSRGDAPIQMPTMYTMRCSTKVTVMTGRPLLVAALSPKSEDGFPDLGRKVMVFVRCDVLQAREAER